MFLVPRTKLLRRGKTSRISQQSLGTSEGLEIHATITFSNYYNMAHKKHSIREGDLCILALTCSPWLSALSSHHW